MAKNKKQNTDSSGTVAVNRKARHDYLIESEYEAGISLLGWEVKSLRAGKAQLTDGYVVIQKAEAWLTACNISPLSTVSTHFKPEPMRARRLLLHREELNKLIGAVERKGYTLVPLKIYFTRGKAKLKLGVGKGKKQHDKRAAEKDKDWKREQSRILKAVNR